MTGDQIGIHDEYVLISRYEAWETASSLADKGRAGTLSPTHPHNGQSLDGQEETKRMKGSMLGHPHKNIEKIEI